MGVELNGVPSSVRFLQALTFSFRPGTSHVAITTSSSPSAREAGASPEQTVVISIPSHEEFTQLVASRFGPLWTERLPSHAQSHHAYEFDRFTIRFGEIRQSQGGAIQSKGTAVEIKYKGEGETGEEEGQVAIDELWSSLGIDSARKCSHASGADKAFDLERHWFEALRSRA